uniref:Hydrophobin n=3 Tax=Tricholoma TaxID=40144 RepID=A0A024BKP2_9AGAR|nr:hydrophobin 3 [Tricholoma vaccinum]
MFSTLAFFLTAFLALFATALPTPGGAPALSQCNTGPIQCCTSTHQSNSTAGAFLLGAVGIPIQNLVTSVGFDCSPITLGIVGGAMGSGAKCASQPVCCNQAYFSGLISNGCDPINIQM